VNLTGFLTMPIGINGGRQNAYALDEIAKILAGGTQAPEYAKHLQSLNEYYQAHPEKVYSVPASGYANISEGEARAYCIVHSLEIPVSLRGPVTPEENDAKLAKLMEEMLEGKRHPKPVAKVHPAKLRPKERKPRKAESFGDALTPAIKEAVAKLSLRGRVLNDEISIKEAANCVEAFLLEPSQSDVILEADVGKENGILLFKRRNGKTEEITTGQLYHRVRREINRDNQG